MITGFPISLLSTSEERDECKLMLLNRKEEKIEHLIFKEGTDFYDDGDVIVLNNTKVFPQGYLEIRKTGARIGSFSFERT